ncbi:MAG: triose-phosphate isomerase [Alphaproteobacteria bacterium]|nr:triose-phosphate isomerase [Alphaproteobacteria bacterium]
MRRKLAAGNWKMNGLRAALSEVELLAKAQPAPNCEVVLCPPATLVRSMAKVCVDNCVTIGAQDCHENSSGAHTGDISAEMLVDAGAEYVILGHSERREAYGESDETVRLKAKAAWAAGLSAIICVGESEEQRRATNTLDIIGGQLAGSIPDAATGENLVVAYEPIWAIGTGLVPSLGDIGEVHDFIRMRLERRFGEGVGRSVRVLYGGSMNPGNVDDIRRVPNVDGGLIGGASLKAADFSKIIAALAA